MRQPEIADCAVGWGAACLPLELIETGPNLTFSARSRAFFGAISDLM